MMGAKTFSIQQERTMKTIILGVLFLFTLGAFAQDEPKFETYLGYSFTRVNSGINVPAFSAQGGLGEVALNLNRWLTAVGSFKQFTMETSVTSTWTRLCLDIILARA